MGGDGVVKTEKRIFDAGCRKKKKKVKLYRKGEGIR